MKETSGIAATIEPPYYAVIFTSLRTDVDGGYGAVAERMVLLASGQPGYLGMETVRDGAFGITVSYWSSEDAVRTWKRNTEHREAQANGRGHWYSRYKVRVARVDRDYGFEAERPARPAGRS